LQAPFFYPERAMGNNPFPSSLQLRAEAAVDRILAEQEAASGAFRSAATAFLHFLRAQYFPLGSPVQGWALDDIERALGDWAHNVRDELILQEIAEDIIQERLGS
jgi:hypothetical protein